MKKFLLLLACVGSISVLKAQATYGIQLHGMLNTASFTSELDPSPEKDLKFGFGGGVLAEVPIKGQFALRGALNYLQKGTKMTEIVSMAEGGGTTEEKSRINLHYLELPLLVVYNFNTNTEGWFVGAGPSFGYAIAGKSEVFQTTRIGTQEITEYFERKAFEDVEDQGLGFKRFDFGLKALVGMHVLENGMVQLGYIHGLSNIASTDDFKGNKFNNRSILLTFGYRFN
jgi:hypothetical protein